MRTQFLLASALCLAAAILNVQVAVRARATPPRVELENEQVRVMRNRYAPHESGAMHEHANHVSVYLTDANLRVTLPDGSSRVATGKAGEVMWGGPTRHAVENLSDEPFEAIDIELRGPPLPLPFAITEDPAQVDPRHHHIEFENDRVRIIRGTVGGHEKTPFHQHPSRVEVWLTDAQLRISLADGSTEQLERKAGQVSWGTPTRHLVENLSDEAFRVIVVELKPPAGARLNSSPAAGTPTR